MPAAECGTGLIDADPGCKSAGSVPGDEAGSEVGLGRPTIGSSDIGPLNGLFTKSVAEGRRLAPPGDDGNWEDVGSSFFSDIGLAVAAAVAGFDVPSWSRSGLGRKGDAVRRSGPPAAVGPVASVVDGAAATIFSAGSELFPESPCVRPEAVTSDRVRNPKGSTGAVGDESEGGDGRFSSTPERETAESDANAA